MQKKPTQKKVPLVRTETGRLVSKAENDFRKKSSSDAMNAQFFSRPGSENKKKAAMYQSMSDINWKKADSAQKADKSYVRSEIERMKAKKKK